MAAVQKIYKWMAVFLPLLATTNVLVSGCHSASKELHICLNIYLERDFPLIETIVNGQQSAMYGRGRLILEDTDLVSICRHISSLYNCYWGLLPECDTIWKYDRYFRVMDVLNATHNHLCSKNTNNVRDLLLNSGCLASARSLIANCTGFDWKMTWRKVLRMEVNPSDGCEELEAYQECLKSRLGDVICGPQASKVYLKVIGVWLRHWCGKNLTPEKERQYFYISRANTEEAINKSLEEIQRRKELNDI